MWSRDERLVEAMRAAVAVLQPSEWVLAVWAIPAVGDWGHVDELWPQIKPESAPQYFGDSHSGRVVLVDIRDSDRYF